MPRLTLPRVADESMPEAHDEKNSAALCSQSVVPFTFVEACPSSRAPRHLTCSESHNGNSEEHGCATRWKCQGPEVGNTRDRHEDTKRDTKRDMRKLRRRTKQQIPAPNTTECSMGTPRQPNSTAAVCTGYLIEKRTVLVSAPFVPQGRNCFPVVQEQSPHSGSHCSPPKERRRLRAYSFATRETSGCFSKPKAATTSAVSRLWEPFCRETSGLAAREPCPQPTRREGEALWRRHSRRP